MNSLKNNKATHFCIANKLMRESKLEEAIAYYRSAIAQNPNFSWFHHNLAEALVKQGQLDEAIAAYRRAIEINPNFASFHHNLAEALVKQGQLDEAIASYRRAIEIKPNCHQSREKLALALAKKRQLAISCEPFQLLDSYWRAFHNLDLKVLSNLTYESLACAIATPDLKDKFHSLFSKLDKTDIEEIANLFTYHGLKFDKNRYDELIKFATNRDFTIDIIGHAVKSGIVKIPSPFSSNDAIACQSILVGGVNLILFRDGSNSFYISQLYQQVSLVFPSMFFAVRIGDSKDVAKWVNNNCIYGILKCLVDHYNILLINNFEPGKYSGLLVANYRPYHYFYECMNGLHILYQNGLINEFTQVYTLERANFISIGDMYGLKNKDHVSNYQDMNKALLKARSFIVAPIVNYYRYGNPEILANLDATLVKKARFLCGTSETEIIDNLLGSAKECFPLVWIGVAGEKRSWKELGEGIPKIINLIHQSFPNVGVVFDGRTFPLTPSPGDYKHLQMDNERAKQIEERLDADIKTFNIIGKTALEKLRWASLVDFFITHYATDSMYVSRMCKKPGVVHFPKCMSASARAFHLHHNVLEIPEEAITDYTDPNKPNDWSYASYSIPWEIVYEQVLKLWESMPVSKLRPLLCYLKSPDF